MIEIRNEIDEIINEKYDQENNVFINPSHTQMYLIKIKNVLCFFQWKIYLAKSSN